VKLRNRLKDRRAGRGWTQADLAVLAGVSRKTINTIENEVFTPSALLALKLAQVFDVAVEDLFYLEEDSAG
jgi:putative transcriptional regulator